MRSITMCKFNSRRVVWATKKKTWISPKKVYSAFTKLRNISGLLTELSGYGLNTGI
jgi:hypothetical protein